MEVLDFDGGIHTLSALVFIKIDAFSVLSGTGFSCTTIYNGNGNFCVIVTLTLTSVSLYVSVTMSNKNDVFVKSKRKMQWAFSVCWGQARRGNRIQKNIDIVFVISGSCISLRHPVIQKKSLPKILAISGEFAMLQ